jgi:hypothetical protein
LICIGFRCFDRTLEKYGKGVERPTPINNNVILQPKEGVGGEGGVGGIGAAEVCVEKETILNFLF